MKRAIIGAILLATTLTAPVMAEVHSDISFRQVKHRLDFCNDYSKSEITDILNSWVFSNVITDPFKTSIPYDEEDYSISTVVSEDEWQKLSDNERQEIGLATQCLAYKEKGIAIAYIVNSQLTKIIVKLYLGFYDGQYREPYNCHAEEDMGWPCVESFR